MNIINLTPHAINFVNAESQPLLTVPASGTIARLSAKTVTVGEFDGIPVTETQYGEIVGLPEPQEGTVYIVSGLVAGQCKHRNDIFIPNELVRDSEGNIIGCKSLGRV
jgi:hypothetical protein